MSTASIRGAQRTEQWRERITRQADSGKSVAPFCREQGIASPTFYWWQRHAKPAVSLAPNLRHCFTLSSEKG